MCHNLPSGRYTRSVVRNCLTLLTRTSVSSKWRPNRRGAWPGMFSIFMHTSMPLKALSTVLFSFSIEVTIPRLANWNRQRTCSVGRVPHPHSCIENRTSLLGTQIGVPLARKPASTHTPMMIGSRELNTYCGSIRNLQGNTFK